jgi:uncharacterized protein YcfJ
MGLMAESVASAISAIEAGALSIAGVKTFTTSPVVPDATTSAQAASYKNITDLIAAQTNTTTGHDHDGTDSKTISGNQFGAWATKTVNTVYQAATDGFAMAVNSRVIYGYTDSNAAPTTVRAWCENNTYAGFIIMPVKKNDYWKIGNYQGTAPTIYWIPLGS